jgi:hypothetical protein
MVDAVSPAGLVLDLQVIRPQPVVEVDGAIVCVVDGEPLFRRADAAVAAIDGAVQDGRLADEAVYDHDVRKHFATGSDLVADFDGKQRRLPVEALPTLEAHPGPAVLRERCRLRRLRVL